MAVPGPPGPLWAVALLVWAASAAVLGEAVRWLVARWVPLWRLDEPVERGLLDLYLGGAVWYLVAAVPVGAFGLVWVVGTPAVAALGLLAVTVRARRTGRSTGVARTFARLGEIGPLVAVAAALGLYLVELVPALGAGTGNTFDSSLLTTYTALLLRHGSIPLSFRPYATTMILYPQGTTVWLGAAQLDFGLPPARASLLVTPLFLALAPLAGYVFGRRWFGRDRAGAAVAVVVAALGPATRAVVGGSNDLAIAFPLVLVLLAEAEVWSRTELPGWGSAVGWGLLFGWSAAINPVGAEWAFPAVLGLAVTAGPRGARRAAAAVGRWGAAVVAALGPVVPSLYVLALGRSSPGYVPGAPVPAEATRAGLSVPQFVGGIDPFLFRAGDVELSPIAPERAELAVLLVLGVGLVVIVAAGIGPVRATVSRFGRFAVASGVAIGAEMLLLVAAGAGWPVARSVAPIASGSELSLWLFAVYGLVAAVPLVVALDPIGSAAPTARPAAADRFGPRLGRRSLRALASVAIALAIVAPGVVLTPAELPPVLASLYGDFGSVTPADFALLACGARLPAGARVVVDPGSAAEFLPGYARDITLLYPMVPDWPWANPSYRVVVDELRNATLDAAGERALTALSAGYVAVTGANTVLWPPFSPLPLEHDPNATELFHDGDAYLFALGSAPTFACG